MAYPNMLRIMLNEQLPSQSAPQSSRPLNSVRGIVSHSFRFGHSSSGNRVETFLVEGCHIPHTLVQKLLIE